MHEPTIIAPPTELDVATVDEFRLALADAVESASARLVIDLSEVGFIDSTALAAILDVNEQLRRAHRRLAIVAPRGTAAAVLLTLSGLRSTLAVYDSRGAALRDSTSTR